MISVGLKANGVGMDTPMAMKEPGEALDEVMSNVRHGLSEYLDATCAGEDELCNRINNVNNRIDEVETRLHELKSNRASLEAQLQTTRIMISELRGTLAASRDNYGKILSLKEQDITGADTYSDAEIPTPRRSEYVGEVATTMADPRHPMGYGL